VDDDGSVGFEAQVGAALLVHPNVAESAIANFRLSVAEDLTVPEIAGTQDDRFDKIVAGYRNQQDLTGVTLRQNDCGYLPAGPVFFVVDGNFQF